MRFVSRPDDPLWDGAGSQNDVTRHFLGAASRPAAQTHHMGHLGRCGTVRRTASDATPTRSFGFAFANRLEPPD